MKLRNYYGVQYHSDFALNDDTDKIRSWGTATAIRFENKAQRDKWVNLHHLNYSCTCDFARACGYIENYSNGN